MLEVNIATIGFPDRPTLPVARDLSFVVGNGETVALFGPSGGGKTTILRAIAGLHRNWTGKILLDGQPVSGVHPSIGMVSQGIVTFDWLTVRENIAFGCRYGRGDRSHIAEVARRVGLDDDVLDARPHVLSGGMKQRMAIARAIITRPRLLLLDEPLSALDAIAREGLQELLVRPANGADLPSMLCVSHDPDEVAFVANRVLFLAGSPATIRDELARPDDLGGRYTPKFQEYRQEIRNRLGRVA